MAKKPIREATGLIRNGLPQLNYYNQILTELYKKKSMAELNSKSSNILDNHINHSCAKKFSEREKNEKKMKSRGKEKKE